MLLKAEKILLRCTAMGPCRRTLVRVAYLKNMPTTTSITFPDDLLRDIDRVDKNRSAFLERAARRYLAELSSAEGSVRDVADKDIYERRAEQLNAEAAEVLELQSLPE
jgi:hypothetical protein